MSKEQLRFRVARVGSEGALVPSDGITAGRLRERGYKTGDIVMAEVRKPRNPGFHRLAHAFGAMVADNIDSFAGMDAHRALKRLQWESGIGCDEMGVQAPGVGFVMVRMPKSLSFASMEQGEFHEVIRGLARHVADTYWPDLSPEEVERMAEIMPEEAA